MLTLTQDQYANLQSQLLELPAKYSLTILQYLHKLVENEQKSMANMKNGHKPWTDKEVSWQAKEGTGLAPDTPKLQITSDSGEVVFKVN